MFNLILFFVLTILIHQRYVISYLSLIFKYIFYDAIPFNNLVTIQMYMFYFFQIFSFLKRMHYQYYNFYNNYIKMDLIDYHLFSNINQSYIILGDQIDQLQTQNPIYFLDNSNNLIATQLPEMQFGNYKLFLKIFLDINNQILKLSYLHIGQFILKIANQFQKTFLLKKLLTLGSNLQSKFSQFIFRLHPISGQLYIQTTYNLNSIFLKKKTQSFKHLINSLVLKHKKIIQCLFINILYIFTDNTNDKIFNGFTFKDYILHSNLYAWNVLQASTSSESKSNQYFQLKRKCKYKHQFILPSYYSKILNEVYRISKQQQFFFHELSDHEDNNIKNNFSPKIQAFINKKNQLIDQKLPISLQDIKQSRKNYLKVNTSREIYEVRFQQYKQSDRIRLVRQKKILKKIPNQEFMGLVRYYFPKQASKVLELFRFTNLYRSINLRQYLSKNSVTVSIFTKISFLNQMIITLQYIRDNNIVFGNLYYGNIFIKNKKIVKLDSFTNAFHRNIEKLNKLYVNRFPYFYQMNNLSNMHFNNTENQRFDVSSFCHIFYQMIFNKSIIGIKDSLLQSINKQFQFERTLRFKKFYNEDCNNYGDPIITLIYFLCMRGTPFLSESYKQRPYIDWMVIINNFLEKYYQNRVFYLLKPKNLKEQQSINDSSISKYE